MLLEPALADPRALGDARVLVLLELLRADLEHAPEDLRGELLLRIAAQVALLDDDALELVGVLAHVVELRARHVGDGS